MGFFRQFTDALGVSLTSAGDITGAPDGTVFSKSSGAQYTYTKGLMTRSGASGASGAVISGAIRAHETDRAVHFVNNLTASGPPLATDDLNAGYTPGSVWVDAVLGQVFVCVDNTVGNAVWGTNPLGKTIKTPVIQIGNIRSGAPTVAAGTFVTSSTGDVHHSTDWAVLDSSGVKVWSQPADTVNLTSVRVPPLALSPSTTYTMSVTFNSWIGKSLPALVTFTTAVASVDVFGTYTGKASLPVQLSLYGISTLQTGEIFVTGGATTAAITSGTANTYIYDPVLDIWASGPALPTMLVAHAQCTMSDGRVCIAGGFANGGSAGSVFTYIYDHATGVFHPAAALSGPSAYGTASQYRSGILYSAGLITDRSRTEIYTPGPTGGIYSLGPVLPVNISAYPAQCTLYDGRIFITDTNAGYAVYSTNDSTGTLSAWVPETTIPTIPTGSALSTRHQIITLQTGDVVLYDGVFNKYDTLNSIWSIISTAGNGVSGTSLLNTGGIFVSGTTSGVLT